MIGYLQIPGPFHRSVSRVAAFIEEHNGGLIAEYEQVMPKESRWMKNVALCPARVLGSYEGLSTSLYQ
jgi:hypothetical protein